MLHDDIYKYFKSGPLSSLQWICGDEDPSHLTCNGAADPSAQGHSAVRVMSMLHLCCRRRQVLLCGREGGTNYIQNAAPDGPSAWVASSIAERVRHDSGRL